MKSRAMKEDRIIRSEEFKHIHIFVNIRGDFNYNAIESTFNTC